MEKYLSGKIFKQILALLLITVICASSSVVSFAQRVDTEIENEYGTIAGISGRNATFLSVFSSFDTSDYYSDQSEVVNILRSGMTEYKDQITINFACNVEHTQESLSELVKGWFDEVFAETDKSYEGDYLYANFSAFNAENITYRSVKGVYYYTIPFDFQYNLNASQESILKIEIDKLIEGFGFTSDTTDKEKCDVIYEYITKNIRYDYTSPSDYLLRYTAYAALINKTAVCQGYATLFYRVAKECGLKVRAIRGTSRGEGHMWNIVKIGQYYYNLDATWDEGVTKYRYYLKGSEDFDNHVAESTFETEEFKKQYPISKTAYKENAFLPCVNGHTYDNEVDNCCNVCNEVRVLGAQLYKETDGEFYYYLNGVKQTEVTDLVKMDGTWYYISNGVWDTSIDTLHKINGKWFLIQKGIWKSQTAIVLYSGKYFYVSGGKWDSSVNKIVSYNGKNYYVKSGKWDSSVNGVKTIGSTSYLIKKGMWSKTTELYKSGSTYYYIKSGKWSKTTNIIKIGSTSYYIKSGKWSNTTGIVKIGSTQYYVKSGKWTKTTTLYKKSGKYYAIKDGKVTNSKVIIKYSGKKYYCYKGYAQTSYSGKVTVSGKKYTVKKGIVK